MRKRVYIAGPISKGDLAENINAATDAFHALLHAGFAPLCPHWSAFSGGVYRSTEEKVPFALAETLPLSTTHEDWVAVDLPWVSVADAVLRIGGESVGADREVAEAKRLGIPVFTNFTELKAWGRGQLPEVTEAKPPELRIYDPGDSGDDFEKAHAEWRANAEGSSGGIKGVGKDAPIATNAAGGKQSATPYRCDLLPPHATLAVAEVLAEGAAKYCANNWHKIAVEDHLNHALAHIFADRAGDTQDAHLEHAACRLLMALDQRRSGRSKAGA